MFCYYTRISKPSWPKPGHNTATWLAVEVALEVAHLVVIKHTSCKTYTHLPMVAVSKPVMHMKAKLWHQKALG